ncbi:putative inorganic carbon transporter subunit DabA [Xanthomonas citri]|uniref:putative inorganic carbon transporter subunit DabA n=1 Tax=Xanthomonas citri TaxID=346 RepID=UPI000B5EC13D|nr:putative inorganic carbon transporter subunit DabA [Xanthomonas citri]ASN01214.1 hypothetical protein APY29_10345 [Xanthomonas citri pv. malvacearum]
MSLYLLPLFAPLLLLTAAVVALVRGDRRPLKIPLLAEGAALGALCIAIASLALVLLRGTGDSPLIGWGDIGLAARLDAVSVTMLLLVTFVGWIVVRYARTYLDGEARQGYFTGWLCMALAAVLLLVQAGNLIQVVIAWIATSIAMHRLLLFYPERVFSTTGGIALTCGALLIWKSMGTTDIATINAMAARGQHSWSLVAAAALLALAAVLKSAQFPTHGWLTEMMEAPTPVSALLHAGVVNGGGFLLIRFADLMLAAPGVLAIRMLWEAALLGNGGCALVPGWRTAIAAYAEPVAATSDDVIDSILQEAAERAAQRKLNAVLAAPSPAQVAAGRVKLQMAFCIDVRSEVFRRALESLDSGIQTLGFAGFFGLGIGHRRFASDVVEARLPVLLAPGVVTCAGDATASAAASDLSARIAARAKRAWGRFKLAAISSFAFVEATGPIYVAKLLRDGLALARQHAPNEPAPRPADGLDLETRLTMATRILKAMSFTGGFARLVVLAGHGAKVVNNPHASALHCGACGGYSGEVNARLLASLLNDSQVRAGLAARGIVIPADTLFLAALHDTTTDAVTLYTADHASPGHAEDLAQAAQWLAAAGALARGERAARLPRAHRSQDIAHRARDWAEIRPEWALAGCQAFIAAPRARTAGRDLAGRAFLHDYDWRYDDGFGVLELILTAPVVVASWISLQYYGSTVAPESFGAGNKLLHNVTGGIGVVEGNGGILRTGLPWQSVHDGQRLTHEPLRLSVLIEAPPEAIANILERHPQVRALFDNRWLHLFALDDEGRMAHRYLGNLRWETSFGDAHSQSDRTPILA